MKKQCGIVGRALVVSYAVTLLSLLLLSFLVFRFSWDEQKVFSGVVVIYVTATFLGGFFAGKLAKTKKFAWGIGVGILYFAVLFFVSLALHKGPGEGNGSLLLQIALCAGGGMLGGMLSS